MKWSGKRFASPKSVQRRMIVLLVTIFIPLSLLLFIVYRLSEHTLLGKVEQINRVTVEQTASRVQDLFQRAFMATNLFINDKQFLHALEEKDPYDVEKTYTYLQAVERLQYAFFLNEKYAVVIRDLHGHTFESETSRLGLRKGQLTESLLPGMQGVQLDLFHSYIWSMLSLTDTKGNPSQFLVITRWLFSPETANKKGIVAIAIPIAYIEQILQNSDGYFEIRDREKHVVYINRNQTNEGKTRDAGQDKFVALPLPPTDWTLYQWRGTDFIDRQLKWFHSVIYLSITTILLIYVVASTYVFRTMRQIFYQIRSLSKQLAMNSPVLNISFQSDRHLIELSELLRQLVHNLNTSRANFEMVSEEKRKLEMQMLQQQMNPHFLLNTLNTIRFLADQASQHRLSSLVLSLSFLLRQQLYGEEEYWTLREEKEYLEKYTVIQRARFGEGFRVHIDVAPDAADVPILRMLVQPLLENCFEHAFPGKTEGNIRVRCRRQANGLEITVSDDGVGMQFSVPQGTISSIGLNNVRERIRLYYGEEAGFSIASGPNQGTTITLLLPVEKR
jgi:sensor histidine kinase YesM